MQHAPCTNSFNVTPRYGLMPPSQSYSSSIQSPTFNKKQCYYQVILGKKQFSRVVMVYCIFFLLLQFQLQYQCIFNRFFETKMLLLIVDLFFPFNKLLFILMLSIARERESHISNPERLCEFLQHFYFIHFVQQFLDGTEILNQTSHCKYHYNIAIHLHFTCKTRRRIGIT